MEAVKANLIEIGLLDVDFCINGQLVVDAVKEELDKPIPHDY